MINTKTIELNYEEAQTLRRALLDKMQEIDLTNAFNEPYYRALDKLYTKLETIEEELEEERN